jgi:hypothetical protein
VDALDRREVGVDIDRHLYCGGGAEGLHDFRDERTVEEETNLQSVVC